MSPSIVMDWMADEGKRLSDCRNDNPLGVLGPQPFEDKWAVRVWMPEADQVSLLLNEQQISLTNQNHPWIFETLLNENPGSNYQVNVLRGGINHTQFDPWAFRNECMGWETPSHAKKTWRDLGTFYT